MYQAPEQLVAMNKANLEIAMKFASVALQGAERMLDLQLKAAKTAFADGVENAKAIASIKDVQQLASLKDDLAQPAIEKATAYARGVYDVATATQAEFGKLIEAQVAEYNKVAKQFTEVTQSNFEAVAKQAVNAPKKAKKA